MDSSPERTDRLRRLAASAGIAAALIGTMAMTGWVLGIDFLKSVVPGLITMKANTALVLMLLGVSLHAAAVDSGRHKTAARMATLLGFTLSATVFSQYVHGHDLGVDLLLFYEPQGTAGTIHPGRMALNTSACFVLVSAALIVIDTKRAATVTPAIGLVVSATALLALVGYFTGLTNLYGFADQIQMAVPTAVGIAFLGCGLLASRPDRGPMRLLASDGAGGTLVRRILPVAVLGTLVLTVLRLAGQAAGLYRTATGAWLLTSVFIAMLVLIVWRVGWSIERADAERRNAAKELKRLSERDPLTGLYNRRRLHEEIQRQLAILDRHARPFALLMIDLDHFKQVNDTAGHATGDALLVEVAHALKRQSRTADYVARIGGDEFVFLLPEVKEGAVEAVTAKLLNALRAIRVPAGDTTVTPSASIGGLTCLPPGDRTWTPESVLSAADLQLYAAKAAGRDGASHRSLALATQPPASVPS